MRKALGNHLLFNPDCNLSKREEDMLTGSEMNNSDVSLFRVTVWGEWYASLSNLVQCRHTKIFMQEKEGACLPPDSGIQTSTEESCELWLFVKYNRRFSQNRCPLGHFSLCCSSQGSRCACQGFFLKKGNFPPRDSEEAVCQ